MDNTRLVKVLAYAQDLTDQMSEQFAQSWGWMDEDGEFTDVERTVIYRAVRHFGISGDNISAEVISDEFSDAEDEANIELFDTGLEAISFMTDEQRRDFARSILEA